eukprot:1160447-Pelagomonas_calceolata.AAC.1
MHAVCLYKSLWCVVPLRVRHVRKSASVAPGAKSVHSANFFMHTCKRAHGVHGCACVCYVQCACRKRGQGSIPAGAGTGDHPAHQLLLHEVY